MILLNLGATADIADIFTDSLPNTVVHVIDSHRPISLHNLFSEAPYATAVLIDKDQEKNVPRPEQMEIVVWSDVEGSSDDAKKSLNVLAEAFEVLRVSF